MQIQDVETHAVLVDLAVVAANILRAQRLFDGLGKRFRPHIKTHKIPYLARLQMQAGAIGIACQKISEAEVFTAQDFDDILLCFNLLSADKIARARTLAEQGRLTIVADNAEVIARLSAGMAGAATPLRVVIECDTGMGRCGVQSPEGARDLARLIGAAKGLRFAGLMTYPKPDDELAVEAFLTRARDLCLQDVGPSEVISSGGTPSISLAHLSPSITEYRAGTYIYNDRSLIARGSCGVSDCALTVLTTVVSRPTPDRGVLDAGSKSLTSDLLGLAGYGMIPAYPGARINNLSEEHGHLDLHLCDHRPKIGEKLQVIPNHACPVSNLVDQVVFHRAGQVIRWEDVAARGCVA